MKCSPQYAGATIAVHIIRHMSALFSLELSGRLSWLQSIRKQRTAWLFRRSVDTYRPRITWLRSSIAGLNTYRQALCDLISFRAAGFSGGDGHWTWEIGDEIPKWPKKPSRNVELKDLLVIPQVCPSRSSLELVTKNIGIYLSDRTRGL